MWWGAGGRWTPDSVTMMVKRSAASSRRRTVAAMAGSPEIDVETLPALLRAVVDRAADEGQRVVLISNGKPTAAVISAEDLEHFESLELAADTA